MTLELVDGVTHARVCVWLNACLDYFRAQVRVCVGNPKTIGGVLQRCEGGPLKLVILVINDVPQNAACTCSLNSRVQPSQYIHAHVCDHLEVRVYNN